METPKKKRGRPAKVPVSEPAAAHKSVYTIELSIGGTTIVNSGTTMLEALEGLEKPSKIVTKGTIKVFHGTKEKELFFMPIQMKRVFYPLARVTIAKMLAMNL